MRTRTTAPVAVQIFAAKPNTLFPEHQRALVCFLRYSQAVPCAACGKRSRHQWTLRVSFQVSRMPEHGVLLQASETIHLPLTPVCRSHLLQPADWPTSAGRRRAQAPAAAPGAHEAGEGER